LLELGLGHYDEVITSSGGTGPEDGHPDLIEARVRSGSPPTGNQLDALATNTTLPGLEGLTPQEYQVARAVVTGATNRDVAYALFLSTKTIEYHLGNVLRKLGVRTRTELAHRFPELLGT
jgi:DNA-binding NarL/FixJ family response regulator